MMLLVRPLRRPHLRTSIVSPICRHAYSFSTIRSFQSNTASNSFTPLPPALLIPPGSSHHSTLSTFLTYAARTALSPHSPYYIGTHYEYTVQAALARLGFSLLRTGAAHDAGIDLIGHWVLSTGQKQSAGIGDTDSWGGRGREEEEEGIRVLIQCKSLKSRVTPSHVRELEGSFRGIPQAWKGPLLNSNRAVLGLLATTNPATRGVIDALRLSRLAVGFVCVGREGRIRQLFWNRVAEERGLGGWGVVKRFDGVGGGAEGGEEVGEKEKGGEDVQVTWLGRPVEMEVRGKEEEAMVLGKDLGAASVNSKAGTRRSSAASIRGISTASGSSPVMKSHASSALTATPAPDKPRRGRPKGSKNRPKTAAVDALPAL